MSKSIARKYAISAIIATILFVVLRLIATLFFTEKDYGVYVRHSIFPQIFEYALLAITVILILVPCFKRAEFAHHVMRDNTKATFFTTAILGFMFLASTMLILLTMVSQGHFSLVNIILSVSGIFAAVYYLSSIFSRKCHAEKEALLSMVPIIWAITALVDVYFDMTVLISGPNRTFNQLALLAFSVFLLAETRIKLSFENNLLYAPAAAVSTLFLAVSSIPNLVCPHILLIGESDRPIIYAVELAAALYSATGLYRFCASGKSNCLYMKKILLIITAIIVLIVLIADIPLMFNGSLESVPSPEQIEKGRIGYSFIAITLILIEAFLITKISRK